jgi:hypothetical protein
MLKPALVAFLAVICANSSAAADWLQLASTDTYTLYAAPTTIRRDGSIASMVHLVDYKEGRTLDGASPYKSTRLQQENDCGQAKARLVYVSLHSEAMAGGEVVLSDAALERWEAVPPGSGRETVWKFVCGRS